MTRFNFSTLVIIGLMHNALAQAADKWQIADQQVIRISPTAFSKLPAKVKSALQERGCTIPQTYFSAQPHNVIRGEFERKGQIDWAVVCSINHSSSIMIFWGGSDKAISEIEKTPDKHWLQNIGNKQIGFSRLIRPVRKRSILNYFKLNGEHKPFSKVHEGIDEAFLEKGSTIHYYDKGKWLKLAGG